MAPLFDDTNKKYNDIEKDLPEINGSLLNLSNNDIHNFEKDENRQEKLINIINEYGCGSCGPRNFYGGTLEHVSLEEEIKKLYNVNDVIIINYGPNIMSSVIPVYAKPDNVVLVDELCNYPIHLGYRLGKAKVIKFKHNDTKDLSDKLEEAKKLIKSSYSLISIVTEGISQNDDSISPLKEIVNIKKNF